MCNARGEICRRHAVHAPHSSQILMQFFFLLPTATVDERQDVQQKTFTKWINHHLNKAGHEPIKNLFEDLRDGHKLLALLETLTNQKYVRLDGAAALNEVK